MGNLYERKGFIKGIIIIIIPLSVIVLLLLTLIFPNIFQKYSGVLTFYSLLIAITSFFIHELFANIKEKEKGISVLRNIEQQRRDIETQLDFFGNNLKLGKPPVHTMTYFNNDLLLELPQEINSRSTDIIKNKISFANDKIDTLNEIRDKLWDIVWDKNERQIREYSKRPIINEALTEVDKAVNDLKDTLRKIESVIKYLGVV